MIEVVFYSNPKRGKPAVKLWLDGGKKKEIPVDQSALIAFQKQCFTPSSLFAVSIFRRGNNHSPMKLTAEILDPIEILQPCSTTAFFGYLVEIPPGKSLLKVNSSSSDWEEVVRGPGVLFLQTSSGFPWNILLEQPLTQDPPSFLKMIDWVRQGVDGDFETVSQLLETMANDPDLKKLFTCVSDNLPENTKKILRQKALSHPLGEDSTGISYLLLHPPVELAHASKRGGVVLIFSTDENPFQTGRWRVWKCLLEEFPGLLKKMLVPLKLPLRLVVLTLPRARDKGSLGHGLISVRKASPPEPVRKFIRACLEQN